MKNTKSARLYFVFILISVCCLSTRAQVTTGTPPLGSFGSGPDVINLGNLNTHIAIPVLHKAGRGITFGYDLSYDSSIWLPVTSNGIQSWKNMTDTNWGWTTSLPSAGHLSYSVSETDSSCYVGRVKEFQITINYNNWKYYDGRGTPHPIPGSSYTSNGPCDGSSKGGFSSTASDGSGYSMSVSGNTVTSLTARNGAIINPYTQGVTLQDGNGNQITASSGNYYDTLSGTTPVLVVAGSGTPSSPITYTYTAPSGANASYTTRYTAYTVQTNFGCSGITEYGATANNLVSEIDLPDVAVNPNDKYTFTYEVTPGDAHAPHYVTGRLASVTLPTGGTISYTYSGGSNGIECVDGSTAGLTRVTPDGTWTYARSGSGSAWTTTVTAPQCNSQTNQTVITFQQESTNNNFYETERQTYQGSSTSGTLLKTRFTCYNAASVPCNSTAITLPITQRSSYLHWPGSGGLESRTDIFYDSTYGRATETDEYAYGAGSPGSLVRKTLTTYASLGNGIVSMPATVTVEDGSSTVKAKTTYSYDQTAVTATSGTPQQVSVSGSRGNATTIAYLVSGSTTLSKIFTYFDTGNLQTATDMNGAQTTYTYGACGNSFPTSVSEPLSLSKSRAWNCTGGVATSATDENGQIVTTNYATDPDFWRPNSAVDQLSNTTSFTYNLQTSAERSLVFNSSTSDVLTNVDGLGRAHVSQKKEAPSSTTYDSVETDYDALGRPERTTLPYTGTAGQTNSSAPGSSITYDALGRKIQVTDGGGKTISYTYSQNDTYHTIGPAPTGENAKRKQFEYDALGRLTSVCEVTSATGSGNCAQTTAVTGYWTQYSYDVLNHLISVTQNAQATQANQQSRSYAYDDIGRITSETNPETGSTAPGTTTYYYDSDATCGTSKGDLVKKVDSAGNVVCYAYDALHRPTSSIVSSGPYQSSTPNKYLVYDSATVNGVVMAKTKGRMAEAYTCTACPSTKITDLGISYTARGEPSDVYQSTPHSSGYYHVTQTYWANGAPNVLSNLVGLPTITYNIDGEGRVFSASASSGQNPLSSTTYNVASEPLQVNFGSSDSDTFTYYQNTDQMETYEFNLNGQSVVGTFTWNSIGTLETLAITDPFNTANAQTCSYAHDDLIRIASVNCGSVWSQTFTYDAFGNLSKSGTQSFQPTYSPATNHMTQIGSSTPTYDGNGNVTNDFLHTYAWDAAGRPVTIDGVGATYDAIGRMVEQNRSGTYTEIVYAPSGAKLALMSGQTLTKAFIPLTGGAVAVYNSSGLAYYRHSDHLGSSRFASTPSRIMYSDGAYGPFGEPYAQSGTADPSFTGMNQDTVTNLYDFAAREYGVQGRWPSPDPLGRGAASLKNPQSWNRYAYLLNNPTSMTDASGLLCRHDMPMCSLGMTGDIATYVNVDTNADAMPFSSMGQAVTDAQIQMADYNAQVGASIAASYASDGTDPVYGGAADPGSDPGSGAAAPSYPTSISLLNYEGIPPQAMSVYKAGSDYGGAIVMLIQVNDQSGNPMQVGDMTPVEMIGPEPVLSEPSLPSVGWFGALGAPTDSSGVYLDSAVGTNANVPFLNTFTQTVWVNYQDAGYQVGFITWTVNALNVPATITGTGSINVTLTLPSNAVPGIPP
jgi:RHS repeat-associated protein